MNASAFKSVQTKIIATFLVGALGMVGAGAFTLTKLYDTYQLVREAKTRQLLPAQHARSVVLDFKDMTNMEMVSLQFLRSGDLAMARDCWTRMATANHDGRANGALLAADEVEPSVRALRQQFLADNEAFSAFMEGLDRIPVEQFPAAMARDAATGSHIAHDFATKEAALTASSNALIAGLNKSASADQKQAKDIFDSSMRAAIVALSLSFLAAIALGLLIARAIRRPLRKTVSVLEGVADGDLTQRLEIHSADEVGQMASALNTTLSTVHDVIAQIESDAAKLSSFANHTSNESAVDSKRELGQMADNLSAMISIFRTEPAPHS